MATDVEVQTMDGERLVEFLNGALAKLKNGEPDLDLDFSSVQRVSPAALQTLQKLAATSEEKSVKIVLHGVPVDVYKVLKLARLSGRFSFAS